MNRRERMLLIYDGECDFCLHWVARWRELVGNRVDFEPYQEVAHFYPDIPPEEFEQAVQLIDLDESVRSGADAVFRLLEVAGRRSDRILRLAYDKLPGFAALADRAYAWAAARRSTASKITRLLWADELQRPQYFIVRWLFLRGLGVVYFAAIASVWAQVPGLYGRHGILPVGNTLDIVSERMGASAYWRFPTLAWLWGDERMLIALCTIGCMAAIGLVLNRHPRILAVVCWLIYLSLVTTGGVFMAFQWDILLLEVGFLAMFLAPEGARPVFEFEKSVPRPVILLYRWLLFRLMFMSGAVKLLSGDTSWGIGSLSALSFHYETQPLPTAFAWFAHQLPYLFHQVSCAAVLFIELVLPFLIFAPRGPRAITAAVFVWFQLLIVATGNYNYFNWLTILLCLPLLDDSYLSRFVPSRFLVSKVSRMYAPTRGVVERTGIALVASLLVFVSTGNLTGTFLGREQVPGPMRLAMEAVSPYRLTGGYGLFAVMTKNRREIVIEGSADGKTWQPYAFKYKPGEPGDRPRLVAPHQPRLDWQMWFAALGNYQRNPWLLATMRRLLEGSPPVLSLLADNPFPDEPPRFVRAMLWDYRFSESDEETDDWWVREHPRPYTPVLKR